jgi:hypothetical protein
VCALPELPREALVDSAMQGGDLVLASGECIAVAEHNIGVQFGPEGGQKAKRPNETGASPTIFTVDGCDSQEAGRKP